MKHTYNYKEAIELVNRYQTITLDEIKKAWKQINPAFCAHRVAHQLTGFGHIDTCSLCTPIDIICHKCIYGENAIGGYGCNTGENLTTYYGINNATSPQELFDAYRARAEHIKKLVNRKRKKQIIK